MRTIRNITETNEKVWFYLDSTETWKKFSDTAEAEGFHFGSLPKEKWTSGYVVAVHSSGEMGHVPLFVWCISFSSACSESIRKIDFGKYISGEEEYDCIVPNFKGRIIFPC